MSSLALVIRTRNHAASLMETLRRVHEQYESKVLLTEIVHIDMGSSDGSLGILRLHQPEKLTRLEPERFTNGAALNLAMRMTEAQWVIFLSGDAWPSDVTWLKNLAADLTLIPNLAAMASNQEPRAGLRDVFAHDQYRRFGLGNATGSKLLGGPQGLAAVAVSRATWEVQPFREDLCGCEVEEWASRVERLGWRVQLTPNARVICGCNYTLREVYDQARQEALSWSRAGEVGDPSTLCWRGRTLGAFSRACLSELKYSFEKGNVFTWPHSVAVQLARILGERRGYTEAERSSRHRSASFLEVTPT